MSTHLTVSEESEDVRWFPVDELPEQAPPGWQHRVQKAARQLASRHAQCV